MGPNGPPLKKISGYGPGGKYEKYVKSAELKGGNAGKDEKAEMAEILIKYGNRKRQK